MDWTLNLAFIIVLDLFIYHPVIGHWIRLTGFVYYYCKLYTDCRQTKGDLQGAEEYYLRATVSDPGDGEILAQYAQLVCELHHDSKKASSYFERAVEATPEDRYTFFT